MRPRQGKRSASLTRLTVDWDADAKLAASYFRKELQCLLIARLFEYIGGDEEFDIGLVVSHQGKKWVCLGIFLFRQLLEGDNLFPGSTVDLREVVII